MAKPETVDSRQRPWPRILAWPLARLSVFAACLAIVAVAATVVTRLLVPPAPSPWHAWVMAKNLLLPIAELLVYGALVRRLEHRPPDEIALRRGGAGWLALGLLIGAGTIAIVVSLLWASGFATITRGTGAEGLAGEALVPFTTAVIEELLFRAILFRLTQEAFGTTLAALSSAALFALAHAGNPGATTTTTLLLALDLGVPLAIAFAASRSLWLPIGLHMGWNFALGYLFGTLNSGVFDPHSLLRTTVVGPHWLTGGSFGLEASALTLGLSGVVSGGLIVIAMRRRVWRPIRLPRPGKPVQAPASTPSAT